MSGLFPPGGGEVPIPKNLQIVNVVSGYTILSGVIPPRNSVGIDLAEMRALFVPTSDRLPPSVDLRLVSEGGTFVPNGTTSLQITNNPANQFGSEYKFTSANPGRWYIAWQLHNAEGNSKWTDGNEDPQYVTEYVDTAIDTTEDTGAPADWTVELLAGPIANTYIARITRPLTNGNLIKEIMVQVADGDTVIWRSLDANAGAAVTYYDGSAIAHTLSMNGRRVTRDAGSGFGTAQVGDYACLDVTGAGFAIADCQNRIITAFEGGNAATATWFEVDTPYEPQSLLTLNLKIVLAPWLWGAGDGYLGAQANRGVLASFQPGPRRIAGNRYTQVFYSDPIEVPSAITNPEIRVFISNGYSTSDDSINNSTGVTGGQTLSGPGTDPITYTPIDFENPDIFTFLPGVGYGNSHDRVVAAAGITFRGIHGVGNAYYDESLQLAFCGYLLRGRVYPDPNTGAMRIKTYWDSFVLSTDTGNGACGCNQGLIGPLDYAYDYRFNEKDAAGQEAGVDRVNETNRTGLYNLYTGQASPVADFQMETQLNPRIGGGASRSRYTIRAIYDSSNPLLHFDTDSGLAISYIGFNVAGPLFYVGMHIRSSGNIFRARLLKMEILEGRVETTGQIADYTQNPEDSGLRIFRIWTPGHPLS